MLSVDLNLRNIVVTRRRNTAQQRRSDGAEACETSRKFHVATITSDSKLSNEGRSFIAGAWYTRQGLAVEWKKQGRAPEVPGFCTRECFAGRAEAAGTICQRAHCVALLTPACRGGVRVGVWLLLDDDGLECNCGAKSTGLSIARRPYRFHCTMFISVMRLTTARQTFALFVYCEFNVQHPRRRLSSSRI